MLEFEQLKWERDMAIRQLEEHGIPFCGLQQQLTLQDLDKHKGVVWVEPPDSENGFYALCNKGVITPSSAFQWTARYMYELGYVFFNCKPTDEERAKAKREEADHD